MQYFRKRTNRISKVFQNKKCVFRRHAKYKTKTSFRERAILSRMEGEFTRLSQIYGNHIIFVGTDGDSEWENRSSRFLKPLYTDEVLKIKFVVSAKEDIDEEFGKISIDYEGTKQGGESVVISKRNWYRIKKQYQDRCY